jgi:excinuclease ABC subunit A
MAPLIKDRKGEHKRVIEDLRKAGFVRARIDGEVRELDGVDAEIPLDRYKMHTIEAVIDRSSSARRDDHGSVTPTLSRLADSVETALKLGGGVMIVNVVGGEDLLFSEHYSACVLWHQPARDRATHLFVQQPPRRLPGLHRSGHAPGARSHAYRARRGLDLSLSEGAIEPWSNASKNDRTFPPAQGGGRALWVSSMCPGASCGRSTGEVVLYGAGEMVNCALHQPPWARPHPSRRC